MPKISTTKSNKVTDTIINSLKPSQGKQTEYAHPHETGFGVIVSASGEQKQYFVRGMLNGKQIFRSLGPVPYFGSVDDAQTVARQWRTMMKEGIDPKKELKKAKAERLRQEQEVQARGLTLRQGLARFLIDKRKLGKVRRSTLRNYSEDISRYMGGKRFEGRGTWVVEWMDTPLSEISRTMIETMRLRIRDRAKQRGYKGDFAADKALVSLRVIYNHLLKVDEKFCVPNPTSNIDRLVDRPSDRARNRYIRQEDMKSWFRAVTSYTLSDVQRELVLLILFTGLRRQEACALHWDEVDLEHGVIHLAAHRVKNGREFSLPLSRYIWNRLIRWRSQHPDTGFVFPASKSRKGYVAEPRAILDRISGRDPRTDTTSVAVSVSIHDLRRTFAKWGTREIAGIPASPIWAVSLLCNHKIGGVTQENYAQLDALDFRPDTNRIGQKILAIAEVAQHDQNITPLRGV
jgi:integrase